MEDDGLAGVTGEGIGGAVAASVFDISNNSGAAMAERLHGTRDMTAVFLCQTKKGWRGGLCEFLPERWFKLTLPSKAFCRC